MKYISTSLFFYVTVGLIGLTLADEEGGAIATATETSTVVGQACELDRTGHTVYEDQEDILMDQLLECFIPEGSSLRDLQNATTTEEYRAAMKGYCDQLATINSCRVGVTTLVDQCLVNDTLRSFMVVVNDFETLLDVGCREDGVKLANIIEELRKIRNVSEQGDIVKTCFHSQRDILDDLEGNSPSGVSFTYYRVLRAVKGCVSEAGAGNTNLINMIDTVFDELFKKLKCIHPQSNIEVLCVALEDN